MEQFMEDGRNNVWNNLTMAGTMDGIMKVTMDGTMNATMRQ